MRQTESAVAEFSAGISGLRLLTLVMLAGLVTCGQPVMAQQQQQQKYSAEQLLKMFNPVQKGVEVDTPTADELAKCRVVLEKGSYVVLGPAGQPLRRITDSNGDGPPDMYRYYRLGLEVYREIDSNGDYKNKKNTKPDQFRWMNWGGTRWGIDQNEDGRIETWKVLSPQEAARIAVEALIQGDLPALASVMINESDIQALRVSPGMAKALKESVSDLQKKAQASVSSTKVLNARSQWVRFDPPVPGLVLPEQSGAPDDITVIENAMAYIQNGEKLELISVGEMVQVGDVWKLVSVPTPLDTSGQSVVTMGGIMMGGLGDSDPPVENNNPEMEKLLAELQALDSRSPAPDASPSALSDYNVARANMAEKLIAMSRNDEERTQWIQQMADSVSTATQTGMYRDGLSRLQQLEEAVRANQTLRGYVYYRRLMAEYAVRLKEDDKAGSKAEMEKSREVTQKWWFEQLEGFARQWPNSEDAPDAVVQLAISYELMGRIEDAKAWYGQLAKAYPDTEGGVKAQGALRRLGLTGQKLQLAGKTLQGQALSSAQYQGKTTLVIFWASYAQPFTDDLDAIKAVYAKHQKSGFEILGVNVDPDLRALSAYMKDRGIPWQNLRDAPKEEGMPPGDFGFGIVSVPTMFLVNKDGIVEGGITTRNLELAVDTMIQGKKLESLKPTDPKEEGSDAGFRRDDTAEKGNGAKG